MGRTTRRLFITIALLTPLTSWQSASAGPTGGALPPVLIERLVVADRFGVPADAEMVAANVTAVNPADAGFITVFPCDEDVPATSNINYLTDEIAPNLTLTRLSANGAICIATRSLTDVIVDIVGYVPSGSRISALPGPVRFLDSRDDGPTPLAAGSTTPVAIAGLNGVEPDAAVVMFNLTAIAGDQAGFLTAFPCGEEVPKTSSVNYAPGQVVPNLVTSRLGDDGSVCIFTRAPAEIIVDVTASAIDGITTLGNPVRLIDTRDTGGPVGAKQTLTIDITDRIDVPDTATAAVYNLTSVDSISPGFATSYPCDITLPRVSNLNYGIANVVANGAITKLSADGELCVYTLAQTDLIVDLIGFTEGVTSYVPLAPVRIWDSREGWERTCDWIIVDLNVVNVVTGEIVALPNATTAGELQSGPIINAACNGVLWFAAGLDRPGLYSKPFIGTAIRTPFHDGFASDIWPSLHLVDGQVLINFEDGSLVDPINGTVVWEGPLTQEPVSSIDVSRNGIAVLAWRERDTIIIETWDVLASQRLHRQTTTRGLKFAISPDGRYVALDQAGSVVVMTVFGDAVDGFETPVATTTRFVGNGSLVFCAIFNGIFAWDLYGAIEKRVDGRTLLDRIGSNSCSGSR